MPESNFNRESQSELEELKRKRDELALVNKLNRIITSSLDISQVYQGFVAELRKVVDVDWASAVLIEGREVHLFGVAGKITSAWKLGDKAPLEGTATAWVAKTRKALVEPDLAKERRFWTGEYHLKSGIRSIVYLPLIAKDKVFGALIIGSTRPNAYGEGELALLELVAGQIAMPIQNAKLFQESKERAELLTAIAKLTRVITSTSDINKVYETFAQELKELVPFDRLSIGLKEGDKARLLAVSSTMPIELDTGDTFPFQESALQWIIQHRRTNIEKDFLKERRFPVDELHLKSGLRSAIRVPLISKGEIFGSLNLTSCKPNAYGKWHKRVLEQLAAQISGAIENAKLYQLEKKERGKLEQEIKLKANFLNMLTHELKTPLTPILSSGKLLVEQLEQKGEIESRLAKNILNGALTLNDLLKEFLELAKGEMGLLKVNLKSLEPVSLIQQLAEQHLAMFAAKKQEFRVELPSPLPRVSADEGRTRQVLSNLLCNANKFTPEGGQVTLRASTEKNELVIEVKDTGPGIPLERQTRLFQPYYASKSFPGLGLGLAICKQLIELQGGRIWCHSQPGKGSTFSFSLPLV